MALVVNDRVKETTSSTGTGTWNLDGFVTGFQTFVAGIGDGNTTPYQAENPDDKTEWETGIGTVTDAATDTLARSVLTSSNGDNLVNFTNAPVVGSGWISDTATMRSILNVADGAEVNPDVVSQADAEAGTATDERIWTARRVEQAIAALGGGGGAWTLIGTQVASTSASLTQAGLDSTYDTYAIAISSVDVSVDGADIFLRVGDSGGVDAGASDYKWSSRRIVMTASPAETLEGDVADSEIQLSSLTGVGNIADEGFGAMMFLHRPGDGTVEPNFTWEAITEATFAHYSIAGGGVRLSNITLDRVQILPSSGTFNGRMTVLGLKHT